jgi:hypothetical protein
MRSCLRQKTRCLDSLTSVELVWVILEYGDEKLGQGLVELSRGWVVVVVVDSWAMALWVTG